MRILYHQRTLADGAEGIHIASMVGAFRELGHTVRIAGLASGAHPPQQRHLVERVRAILPNAAFELAAVGVNGLEYLQVRREIEAFRPDLIYKRHARFDVATVMAAHALKVPVALEVNCVFAAPEYQRFEPLALPGLERRIERRAFALSTIALAVSSPLAGQIRALADVHVLVVPNGADPARFDPDRADACRIRTKYGLGPGLTIGWTGILREWHGIELLLEALLTIPDAKLLVVGDGPARPVLEARIGQLHLQHRVIITGRVPHDDVPDHVAAMDIAVVADEKTGVASPMKLVEYMAMRRSVVAPAADNIRDLIEDGVDGLLFQPGSARDLAAALQRLAGQPDLRESLGARARAKVQLERNWRAIARVVLQAIESRPSVQNRTAGATAL